MYKACSLIGGASFGAGLMFFLDPDRGKRRRALARDKGIRWSRKTSDFAGSTSRDVRNHSIGMGAAVKSWIQPTRPVPDRILAERIRAKLGLLSRHPSSIDVHVTDGVATLSGPVLEDEVASICTTIGKIPGVRQVVDRFERHQSPDVPALQGSIERKPGPRVAFMQSNWSPTARMAAALMGTAAVLYGLNQRTVGATTVAASGLGLLVRSATNQDFSRLFNSTESFKEAA